MTLLARIAAAVDHAFRLPPATLGPPTLPARSGVLLW